MRIHLILRSMWPKRAHLDDVHVGVVELIGLVDEACPVIPRIKGLLRGVARNLTTTGVYLMTVCRETCIVYGRWYMLHGTWYTIIYYNSI